MYDIPDKQAFYALSKKLLVGNRLRQWPWLEFCELYREQSNGGPKHLPDLVGVRHVRKSFTNEGTSGIYPLEGAYFYGLKCPDKENLLFDEGAVHRDLTLQGEIMADEKGLYVRCSKLQVHQRTLWHIEANGLTGLEPHQMPHNWRDFCVTHRLRFGHASLIESTGPRIPIVEHLRGLRASLTLRKHMDFESLETIHTILGCQEGPLSTRGDEVVNFRHPIIEFACFNKPIGVLQLNTLVWECRTMY